MTIPRSGRRNLTVKRRKAIAYMSLDYSLREHLDSRAGDEMARQESWYVQIVNGFGEGPVGHATVHRVPLANGEWLDNETDAGDDVPGGPVAAVTDGFDWLSPRVLRRLGNPERSADASFLVVENVQLHEAWRGLALEGLVLARVLVRLLTEDTLFAVAEPVVTHPRRFTNRPGPYQEAVFKTLRFTPLRKGIWLTDLSDIHDVHGAMNERFHVSVTESRGAPGTPARVRRS